jgi:hypothetical protein
MEQRAVAWSSQELSKDLGLQNDLPIFPVSLLDGKLAEENTSLSKACRAGRYTLETLK